MFTEKIEKLGSVAIQNISYAGESFIFIIKTLVKALLPPYQFSQILKQIYYIGFQSLGVIALVGGFTGAVLAVQTEFALGKLGFSGSTGSAVATGLLRELGPVLTALMVNGRAGSAITAELGIMKITEQIDALRSMGVDPIRYLMVPRVVAGLISVPMLTAVFNIVGILGGYLVAVYSLGLPSGTFIGSMKEGVSDVDFFSSLIKSIIFGLCVCWVACFKGWKCGFGAVGVNRATTSAVVMSSVVVLIVDFFLTKIILQFFQ